MLVNAWPTQPSGRDGLTWTGMMPDTDYTLFLCAEDFDGNISPMHFATIRTSEIQVGPDPTINMELVPSRYDNYDWLSSILSIMTWSSSSIAIQTIQQTSRLIFQV